MRAKRDALQTFEIYSDIIDESALVVGVLIYAVKRAHGKIPATVRIVYHMRILPSFSLKYSMPSGKGLLLRLCDATCSILDGGLLQVQPAMH
jgi:hypothetical protein